jgi:hypothetical protein
MSIRLSRLAKGLLIVAAMVLMAGKSWAVFHALPPSKDEWGLKYDVEVAPADGDKVTVVLTMADEGRLKSVYSYHVVAFSKQTDSQGGRSYDVKAPLVLKPTQDGQRTGQVQIRKDLVDRAMIRVLTLNVDGKRQTAGAAYYDIPLRKYMNEPPTAASRQAPPSASKVRK